MHGPVFIVGLPRSGTSTLALGLRNLGYKGYLEGHLLELLPRIEESITAYFCKWESANRPDTMINAVSAEDIAYQFRIFFRNYIATHFGTDAWFDKTATASLMPYLNLLDQTFIGARFIFMRRRPIEFLASAIKKFPQHSVEELCEVYKFTLESWSRESVRLTNKIEVDQWSMLHRPTNVAIRIGAFLGLNNAQRLSLADSLLMRVERSTVEYRDLILGDLNLDQRQLEILVGGLSELVKNYGYGWEKYWLKGEPTD